jgi:PelA/Pel-15E family pectate lyase
MRIQVLVVTMALLTAFTNHVAVAQSDGTTLTDKQVRQSLKLAAEFFRNQVANQGGYVYYCSEDLTQFWGEGKVDGSTIVVQPPATPSVGESYLRCYQVTGDTFFLAAAREAGEALVRGQLRSGGWTQVIHFQPPERGRMGQYRKSKGGRWNNSSLDDDQTQAALRFLAKLDKALEFCHAEIHEATEFGLTALLNAQFDCGAFPQVWSGPVAAQPVLSANYPDYDWRSEGRIKEYWNYYTLNDGLAGSVAETLIVAAEIYGDEKYAGALTRLGDFLVRAQMPAPQPAWCQQYNYAMQPMWARKFEPPAITASESQDVMRALIEIARHTGQHKYLEPIPAAIDYLQRGCLLPDGKLARFYELKSNRPLYMDAKYQLTYDDSDVPSHYSWKVSSQLDRIKRDYLTLKQGGTLERPKFRGADPVGTQRAIEQLDAQGRWVEVFAGEHLMGQPKFPFGFRYISSHTFNVNVAKLCDYLRGG